MSQQRRRGLRREPEDGDRQRGREDLRRERTVTAVGKQRITRRALIPDSLTWEIYDKPSKKKPTTGTDTPATPTTGSGDEG